jgi:hypothetical protein
MTKASNDKRHSTTVKSATEIPPADLQAAYDGSWLIILGTGGDLVEWTQGMGLYFSQQGCGKPRAWYVTNGAEINAFAGANNSNPFNDDLTCLVADWTGMDMGRLAPLRLVMEDAKWFDDLVNNMRGRSDDDDPPYYEDDDE